jgi:hypothetical protein
MVFDAAAYGPEVARLLALDGNGERPMPLASGRCSPPAALQALRASTARQLFPAARATEAAYAGLYLYFSCLDEAHRLAQDLATAEGSFWHGIVHRQEPDPGNAAYWFRRVGRHAIFPALREAAAAIGARYAVAVADPWDPFAFIDLCETARGRSGSPLERAALEMQRAEWQLLFDHCAR